MKLDGIIIIEDNNTMRLGIEETLRRENYNTVSFDNGISALNHFKKYPSEIAIVDLKMEPMNGIEVLEKIKQINSQTEVLMISAYGTVEDAVRAMHLGASDFMTKPFSPDELRIRVKKIYEKILNSQKIEVLIQHPELCQKMGRQGRRCIENNFDVKKLNVALSGMYQELFPKGMHN